MRRWRRLRSENRLRLPVAFRRATRKIVLPPPKAEEPPPPEIVAAPPPPKGFQVLTAPIKIPEVLPDIDLSKKVTDEADFTGKGVEGGQRRGVEVVGGDQLAEIKDQIPKAEADERIDELRATLMGAYYQD